MGDNLFLSAVERILMIAAVAAPAAGLVLGLAAGAIRHRIIRDAAAGLGIGLLGTLIYGMWKLYIAIGKWFGSSSMSGIGVMTTVFLVVGFCVGIAVKLACMRWRQQKL